MTSKNDLRIGIAVMASGAGKRFGSNKLLADACGMTVIERTLNLIDRDLFRPEDVCVVTRYKEIADIAVRYGFRALLHDLPDKSDTVRLGTAALKELEGIMYLQSDQFLLKPSSLGRMAAAFADNKDRPARLCLNGRFGSPVIFPPSYYEKLMGLKGDRGGIGLLDNASITAVTAEQEYEFLDADTPEELERMNLILSSVQYGIK
jgi:molybdenum cofactor cytidylyltransferase